MPVFWLICKFIFFKNDVSWSFDYLCTTGNQMESLYSVGEAVKNGNARRKRPLTWFVRYVTFMTQPVNSFLNQFVLKSIRSHFELQKWHRRENNVILFFYICANYCLNLPNFLDFTNIVTWLTKETLQTFFANGSNRKVEMLKQRGLLWFMTNALCDDVIFCLNRIWCHYV